MWNDSFKEMWSILKHAHMQYTLIDDVRILMAWPCELLCASYTQNDYIHDLKIRCDMCNYVI